jgi:Fic family protein
MEGLENSPIGRLVPIVGTDGRTGEHFEDTAYLPDPLPVAVDLSASTWTAVVRAEASLARLDQAARQVPQPSLLRQPALRREAQSTSALEGTFAPFEEVLESDIEERGHMSLEMHEILNYVVAAEEAFAWVDERPVTTSFIANLQQRLVSGTPSEYGDAGRIRDRQVLIGSGDASVQEARFVPAPPGDQLRAGLEDWVNWINKPSSEMPPVVQAALGHYQFETLHPFSDGNGRIGRLLIVLQLMRRRVLREPILVVSPWFEERRLAYQDGLLTLSQTGDWDSWVHFFATGVAASGDTTHERVERLLSWQEETLARVRASGISGIAERLAGELIGTPFLRANEVALNHGISHQCAMNALRRLAQEGIIDEQLRNGRVVFTARPVVALLSQ